MRHKHFYIVAYDISDDHRRNQVVKLMESIGTRVNYSVFECMLTPKQFDSMYQKLSKIANPRLDQINIYPICTECFARIRYIPDHTQSKPAKIVVV